MKPKRVALDTNLLLLFLIGEVRPGMISQHKRLRAFSPGDYELLREFVSDADFVATPNSMTETANLLVNGVWEPARSLLLQALRTYADQATEIYVASAEAAQRDEFLRLNLADSAWLAALDKETAFVTVDLNLYLAAFDCGVEAVNFNHMRDV